MGAAGADVAPDFVASSLPLLYPLLAEILDNVYGTGVEIEAVFVESPLLFSFSPVVLVTVVEVGVVEIEIGDEMMVVVSGLPVSLFPCPVP